MLASQCSRTIKAARARLALPPHLSGSHPDWHRNAAACGDDHLVKFAWSEPAARKLWHEARESTRR